MFFHFLTSYCCFCGDGYGFIYYTGLSEILIGFLYLTDDLSVVTFVAHSFVDSSGWFYRLIYLIHLSISLLCCFTCVAIYLLDNLLRQFTYLFLVFGVVLCFGYVCALRGPRSCRETLTNTRIHN